MKLKYVRFVFLFFATVCFGSTSLFSQPAGFILGKDGKKIEGKIRTQVFGNSIVLIDRFGAKTRVLPEFVSGYGIYDKASGDLRLFEVLLAPKHILRKRGNSTENYRTFAEKIYDGHFKVYKKDVYYTSNVQSLVVQTYFLFGTDRNNLTAYDFTQLIDKMKAAAKSCPALGNAIPMALQDDIPAMIQLYESCLTGSL